MSMDHELIQPVIFDHFSLHGTLAFQSFFKMATYPCPSLIADPKKWNGTPVNGEGNFNILTVFEIQIIIGGYLKFNDTCLITSVEEKKLNSFKNIQKRGKSNRPMPKFFRIGRHFDSSVAPIWLYGHLSNV